MPETTATLQASIDLFPCGLVVTERTERRIVAANQHFYKLTGFQVNQQVTINSLFSNASRIMLESYVMPILLNQGHCEEIQLTINKGQGRRLPVLVNARITKEFPHLIHWVMTSAKQRDELYQELVNLRNHLEHKAEEYALLAQTDELTGLLNRRAFLENANQQIKVAQQRQFICAFFMIDIDNFKRINDKHGHDVGDQVLRDIADIFRLNSRDGDILARVGGEEFAVVTTVPSAEHAYSLAERLRRAVSAQPIAGLKITTSIGLATSSHHNLSELFKQADKLLYQVKNSGKNRVMHLSI